VTKIRRIFAVGSFLLVFHHLWIGWSQNRTRPRHNSLTGTDGCSCRENRGENLPDTEFLANTLVDSFNVPREQVEGFIRVFVTTLKGAELLEELSSGKSRVLDVTSPTDTTTELGEQQIKKLSKGVTVSADDSCFVVMPFAEPIGGYYASIYEPAIEKAKLKAIRADADLYGTGKIIDQIWHGINSARVLVAELTDRNPNVLYELGLAHALHAPTKLMYRSISGTCESSTTICAIPSGEPS